MGILKFFNSFREENRPNETKKTISDVFEVPNYGEKIAPAKLSSDYLAEMKGWVHSCVTTISDSVGSVEVKLYRYKANGETEEVFIHPILDTLYKINNFTTKFDHFWLTQAYLEMTGECPWYLEKTDGVITGIFILRPDRLTILYDKVNLIGGYEYSISKSSLGKSRVITLRPDEVIFLKVPNPNNVYRGLGTLQAVARTINIDEYAEKWNENFFYNSARPDSILTVKVKRMTDEQRNKIKASLKASHRGLDNAHKTMVLSGDMDYKQVSLSQADMEFMEQQRFSRDKILGIFRVPKVLVAQTDDVNYANARTSENIFAKYVIKPKLERIFSQLNEFLVPMYPDGDTLFLDFENPVKEDQEENMARYKNGINNGYMTINEVREKENLAPIKGDVGNQVFLPMNLVAIGSTDKEEIDNPKEEEKTIEKISSEKIKAFRARTKKSRKLDNVRLQIRKMVKDALIRKSAVSILEEEDVDPELEKKKLFWSTQIKTADETEETFVKEFKKIFTEQEKKVLRKLKQKSIDIDKILLDEKVEVAMGIKFAKPELEKLIKEQGELAMSLVGDMFFDEKDAVIRKYLKERTKEFVTDVTKATNDSIKKILEEGIEKGEGVDVIADSIVEKFSFFKTARAIRIARTEVIRASNFSTEQAYIQSGVVEQKEWLTSFDERTCARCAEMNGKKKNLGDNFFNKGDVFQEIPLDYEDIGFPPLHVNCYDKETEIYTADGWKLFKEVKKKESVLTLNPKTKNLEWSNVKETVKYKVDKILALTNKQHSFDMRVSENHPFFGYKRVDKGKKGRILESKFYNNIKDLPKEEFRFYLSSQWKGINKSFIIIEGIKFKTKDFCKLMGYYLSEGSVSKRKTAYPQISIAQEKYLVEMWDDLKDLPLGSVKLGKDKIYIFDKKLANYLEKFGKSAKKYVPEEIKELSPELIRVFLDAFRLGDGSLRKSTNWKNINFEDMPSYYTSSKRMSDDLGELIIKCGKAVSYRLEKTKGRIQKFKNGSYTINNDIWSIYELSSKYRMFKNINIKEEIYNDYVYDVEVEKNHTIWVRRNGKAVWGSNCRCTLIPVISKKSVKDNIEKKSKKQVEEIKKTIASETKKEVDKLKEKVKESVNNIIEDTKKINEKILNNSEQTKKSIEKSVKESDGELALNKKERKKLEEDTLIDKKKMKEELSSFKKVREEIQTIINEEDGK